MLLWVSFGLVLGGSSLVIGWRRLQKTIAPKKRKVRKAQGVIPQSAETLATETAAD